ncbi:type II toxin-antitoxin system RelE/ParE family toxin [Kribbella sp. NPDC005582]|uniref:type II toxin-antitoxin system RelE/ParE family toxin n=1 Tax=Kribbella sp. NPDC005582 TaxID=3156893 RepID=UPI0033A2BF62
MTYTVAYTEGYAKWLDELSTPDRDRLRARVSLIAELGPGLGRPVVETIKSSRHPNMKELRSGTIRVLFVFDPVRRAVLLIGGDKAGRWEAWYRTNIPIADELYDEWLVEMKKQPGRRKQG